MLKTMKKGFLRTVAFAVSFSILWTTLGNSFFTYTSYAAETTEASVEESSEELKEEEIFEE